MVSDRSPLSLPSKFSWPPLFFGLLSLAGLYAVSRYDFLLFHCLTEAFSIVIAIAVFAIFWNTRQLVGNSIFLVIGFGCLFAGLLDLVYIFCYPGMSVLPGNNANLALQAKTVAQWYVSLSCVGAIPFLKRKLNQNWALAIYSALLALILTAKFCWGVFPDCFVEGVGITPFERIGLAISCSAYLGALILLVGNRREFDRYVFRLLAGTLIAFFVEDFASVLATEMNGFAKTIAHLCQVVALYFVYKAFVEVGLTKPYRLLFRNQQKAAEALERHQQFLRAVLDNVQSGIVACDADGVLTLFNRTMQELHGVPQEPIPAVQWAEYYHLYRPDGKTKMKREEIPLYRALQGERFRNAEFTVVPATGTCRTLVASGEPLVGADGKNHGAVMAVHDITDRKRVEEALRQSEEGLRMVLEAAEIGWWRLDLVGGTLAADQRCKTLFGLPSTSLPSFARFLERVVPEDRAAAREQLAQATARPGDYRAEYRTVWPDGSLHWLFIKGRSLPDAPGVPRCLDGIVMDVTERRQLEQVLRDREERSRLLVESIPQLAWRISPDGLEVECNRRWHEYTGQTPAEVQAHGWLAVVHPDDLFRVIELTAHTARTLEPYKLEYRLRRASDNCYRWHLVRTVPMLGNDGELICWFGSATDIEDLKRAQEVLQRAHQEERRRHRDELAHVARLSMMGEMAAGLAHELNQPLHAIKNYARGSVWRVSKGTEIDHELLAALEQTCKEADRASEIIGRVRRFIRKGDPQIAAVALNALIEEVVMLAQPDIEAHRATVVLELAKQLPSVAADSIQIEQVVMNLVRNGLESMNQTADVRRILTIATTHQPQGVRIDVCDCGSGLREEDLDKIFEPFYTTKPGGMGMGLAISSSIVRSHGGRLWASIDQDRGATFHVLLPLP
jgi:PAS domain S-box-containing protein